MFFIVSASRTNVDLMQERFLKHEAKLLHWEVQDMGIEIVK